MTPDYYQNVTGDLYDEFIRDYGQEAVRLHLLMQAREYLKRAHQKGQRASDLGKVRVLLARLLEWEEASTPTLEDRPHTDLPQVHGVRPRQPLDEMAAILRANNYLIFEGRVDETEWQAIGKKEGYTQAPEMDEAAWRNIGEHYGYTSSLSMIEELQRRGFAVQSTLFPEEEQVLKLQNGSFVRAVPAEEEAYTSATPST